MAKVTQPLSHEGDLQARVPLLPNARGADGCPKAVSPPATPSTEAGPPAITRSFPGRPESVSAARSWAAGHFPDPATAADAALMTSELATNAILYSASGLPGGTFTVSASTIGGSVRVDVTDQGEMPKRQAAPPGLGYGLALVGLLADDYGTSGRDRWFTLPAGL